MNTCVFPFRRRNGLEWTIRSRSRWNGVRRRHSSSARGRPRVPYERTASGERQRSSCARVSSAKASAIRPASSGIPSSVLACPATHAAPIRPLRTAVRAVVTLLRPGHRRDPPYAEHVPTTSSSRATARPTGTPRGASRATPTPPAERRAAASRRAPSPTTSPVSELDAVYSSDLDRARRDGARGRRAVTGLDRRRAPGAARDATSATWEGSSDAEVLERFPDARTRPLGRRRDARRARRAGARRAAAHRATAPGRARARRHAWRARCAQCSLTATVAIGRARSATATSPGSRSKPAVFAQ